MAGIRQLRCAIYTRKSTEEGLEQDFNSLHAQREACAAYILSQKHEGWTPVKTIYDDGGFSGGNLERPALKQLLADIKDGRIDVIVVYKVDRLTRSLADFTRIVDLFDAHNVSFVSITQQFNTTTSMGRLTLNMLLSFAQFEREVTGERIRDKFKASKQKGIFMGGVIPLGYDLCDRKLHINANEAKVVTEIFTRFLAIRNMRILQASLTADQIYTKIRPGKRKAGGNVFSRGALRQMLCNPLYIGKTKHKDQIYEGQHEAIIPKALWDDVQAILSGKLLGPQKHRLSEPNLLLGKLFDEHGIALSTNYANKAGKRYRYYVSKQLKSQTRESVQTAWRLPAQEIENCVARMAAELLMDQTLLTERLLALGIDAAFIPEALKASEELGHQLLQPISRESLFSDLITQVSLSPESITVVVSLESVGAPSGATMDYVKTIKIKRRGYELRLVIENEKNVPVKIDSTLLKTIARAHCWFEELATGKVSSLTEIAQRESVGKSYVGDILKLAFVPPKLVEAIADGGSQNLITDQLIKAPQLLDWQKWPDR